MPRFKPKPLAEQLEAIGLQEDRHGTLRLSHTDLYSRAQREQLDSLSICFDPRSGDWQNIEPPLPGEWLVEQISRTPDQSFKAYVNSIPNKPDRTRNVIYLLPLCDPSELEQPPFPNGPWPSFSALVGAVERFYAPLRVSVMTAIPMEALRPVPHSRRGPYGLQWHAREILDSLKSRVPRDAVGLMAVTMCDLYPKPEWNFVYGLALLAQRVAVFSFIRHTPEDARDEVWAGAELLHSSMKTALHEIGHMFGLKHCTWFNCLMRGNNGAEVEHQHNYLHLCPVCLRKLHWSIGFDIRDQYSGLLEIFREYAATHEHFQADCYFLERRLAAISDLPVGATYISECVPRTSSTAAPKHCSSPVRAVPKSIAARSRALPAIPGRCENSTSTRLARQRTPPRRAQNNSRQNSPTPRSETAVVRREQNTSTCACAQRSRSNSPATEANRRAEQSVRAVFEEALLQGKDVFLSVDELSAILQNMGFQNDHAEALLAAADTDEHGLLDVREFLTWVFASNKDAVMALARVGCYGA